MKIFENISALTGRTPLMSLENYEREINAKGKIIAKLEYFNPAGSVKDRVAKAMIESAEKEGRLKKGDTIIEPTSGNTGIGLAAIAASKGYKVILTMPDTMSIERRKLLSAYGAEIVLTEGSKGMNGAIEEAERLQKEIPGSIIAGQFVNPENPRAHYQTTGPEIFADTEGRADFLVAGVGTGGTLSGTGKFLKENIPGIKVVAVEPAKSAVLSGEKPGAHPLQGIGAGFIPGIYDVEIADEIIKVEGSEAYEAARKLAKTEGILVGISSGAALFAAGEIAKREENKDKIIVVILPDGGDRYLSTELFA